MSLLAAISQERVVSTQLIEGGVDSSVFENFMYHTLRAVRTNPATAEKTVLVFLDNAVIHRHSTVLKSLRKMKVHVMFNAEYSPHLNPVEQLFGLLKRRIKCKDVDSK